MKNLTITDEKVRAGAAEHSDAARILKKMFPEAFAPEVNIHNDIRGAKVPAYMRTTSDAAQNRIIAASGEIIAEPRSDASGSHLPGSIGGLYVSAQYSAQVVIDNQGSTVVVFKKK